jgi:hypothetical protein
VKNIKKERKKEIEIEKGMKIKKEREEEREYGVREILTDC